MTNMNRQSFCYGMLLLLIMMFCQATEAFKYNNFTNPVTITETTTQETPLAKVDCTPSSVYETCRCRITNKGSSPFDVWQLGGGPSDYYVWYVGAANGGPLSYKKNPNYDLFIECYSYLSTETKILEVDVIPNWPPTFTPAAGDKASVNVPANDGDVVYTVKASDKESDPLTFAIKSTVPQVSYFKIDPVSGVITLSTQSNLLTATENSVTVKVQVSDGYNTVDNFDLVVNITNHNHRPDITNLPRTIRIQEDKPIGTTIYSMMVDDPDPQGSRLTPTCVVVPGNEAFKFSFTGTNYQTIKLLHLLDYETTNYYTISCEVTDGYLTSQNEVLTIIVENVNEPPVFEDAAYYCIMEESDAGISFCELGLHDILSDPEGDAITSVAFVPGIGSNRFRYERSTRRVMFTVDYDVDESQMPTKVALQLQATDINAASSQVPVNIQIRDANDNTCNFGPTPFVKHEVHQDTPLRQYGQLSATDSDLTSPNKDVTYEVVRAVPPESSNYIQVYSDGTVAYIGIIPATQNPTSYSLIVRCKDGGTPRRTAETTVLFTYVPLTTTMSTTPTTTPSTTTPTTTTTTKDTDIWDEPPFVATFATLMALLGLSLLVGACLCARFCGWCGQGASWFSSGSGSGSGFQEFCCPRKKPQKVEPVDDYFNNSVRTNPNYHDDYWRQGDKFETGKEQPQQDPSKVTEHRGGRPPPSTKFTL